MPVFHGPKIHQTPVRQARLRIRNTDTACCRRARHQALPGDVLQLMATTGSTSLPPRAHITPIPVSKHSGSARFSHSSLSDFLSFVTAIPSRRCMQSSITNVDHQHQSPTATSIDWLVDAHVVGSWGCAKLFQPWRVLNRLPTC